MTSSNNKYTVFLRQYVWFPPLELGSDQLVPFKPFRNIIGNFFHLLYCELLLTSPLIWSVNNTAASKNISIQAFWKQSFIFKNLNIWIFFLQYSETEISYIITFVSFLNTMQHILYFQAQLVLYNVYTSTIYSYYALESLAHCLFMHIITLLTSVTM